ncbi:caspase-8-like [Gouania willdenowi]|uniref:caspase-8-like n=1 Tax=Gouania willdenowi TaxID=441366 RepID=UPI0010563EA1|nr:caspase-8-like [Gouania willdenowi]
MSARDSMRRNKTDIIFTLSGDHRLVLNKLHEKNLINGREYNNLKSIHGEDVEGHVVELVDKIMNKGEDTCRAFLSLLQTDEDIKATFPRLATSHLLRSRPLPLPIQDSSVDSDALPPESKRVRKEHFYQLSSQPVGLCLILNNEHFMDGSVRSGTDKDAEDLAKVFSWLGFRVLMCKDQTKDQMEQTLLSFASLNDLSPQTLQLESSVLEWSNDTFLNSPQQVIQHGDAFFCCILSHGEKGTVLGIDREALSLKSITSTFRATDDSMLTGKPKVFIIQACQGEKLQRGVTYLEEEDASVQSVPEEADVLLALATVEDHAAVRHTIKGSWFVQSLCQQLRECCPRGDDITKILHRVNYNVSKKEAINSLGARKQMSEFTSRLRKTLVLSPR